MTIERNLPNMFERTITPENAFSYQFAGVGNSELATLLIAMVDPATDNSRAGIYGRVITSQGPYPLWPDIDRGTIGGYLEALLDLRLLKRDGNSYSRSEYGDETVSLAGNLLEFSVSHPDVTLHKIFGNKRVSNPDEEFLSTAPFHIKGTMRRYRIYKRLIESDSPVHLKDFASDLGMRVDHTHRMLVKIQDEGFIFLAEKKSNQHLYKYSGKEGKGVNVGSSDPGLARDALNALRAHPSLWFSSEVLRDYLHSTTYSHINDLGDLRSRVSKALHALFDAELLDKKTRGVKTTVELRDDKKEMFKDLVGRIEGFRQKDPDIIAKGTLFAERALKDKEMFSKLMGKARGQQILLGIV